VRDDPVDFSSTARISSLLRNFRQFSLGISDSLDSTKFLDYNDFESVPWYWSERVKEAVKLFTESHTAMATVHIKT